MYYYLSNFCHLCLENNELATNSEPEIVSIISKLNFCVSEEEWAASTKLCVCKTCLHKLNEAYSFKLQCLKSKTALEKYMRYFKTVSKTKAVQAKLHVSVSRKGIDENLLNEYVASQKKTANPAGALHLIPNQNFFPPLTKLIVTNSANGPLQNIYLNLIPTSMLNLNKTSPQTNEVNQSMFIMSSVNNVMPHPVVSPSKLQAYNFNSESNVSHLPASSRTEELEIDPAAFCETAYDNESAGNRPADKERDWDEEISCNRISAASVAPVGVGGELHSLLSRPVTQVPARPVLPQPEADYSAEVTNEEKVEFFNFGHFLVNPRKSTKYLEKNVMCDLCVATFPSVKALRTHVKESHQPKVAKVVQVKKSKGHSCEMCTRKFATSQGLDRHRMRRHDDDVDEMGQKKYFVKGMKNAKCHICKRSFSTQSYLQVHLKLHDRERPTNRKKYGRTDDKEKMANGDGEDAVAGSDDDTQEVNSATQEVAPEDANHKPGIGKGLKLRINLRNIQNVSEPMETDDTEDEHQMSPEEIEEAYENDPAGQGQDLEPGSASEEQQECRPDEAGFVQGDPASLESKGTSMFTFEWVDGKPRCVYCKKVFGRKHDLKRHINNVHMKSIQYRCHLCKRKFYEGFHLTRHLRGHYCNLVCPQCDKGFCTITEVKNHLVISHDVIGNVDCGVCNISFDDFDVLQEHVDEHLKTIVYKCHLCDDEFTECRDLTKHIVEHSGMYTCGQCSRTFCMEKELLSHLKSHSDEISLRHKCEICQNTFKKKRYLHSHLKNCHSIERHSSG